LCVYEEESVCMCDGGGLGWCEYIDLCVFVCVSAVGCSGIYGFL